MIWIHRIKLTTPRTMTQPWPKENRHADAHGRRATIGKGWKACGRSENIPCIDPPQASERFGTVIYLKVLIFSMHFQKIL